jgi:hypothetical protein
MSGIIELYTSRESTIGKDPSITLMYLIRSDTDNEREVREIVLAETPASYGDSLVPVLRLWRIKSKQMPLGNGYWTAQVDYAIAGKDTGQNPSQQGSNSDQQGQGDPLAPDVQISGKGVMQTITQSLGTRVAVKGAGDARDIPDYKGAILVSKEGVKGTEIPVPSMAWSETWVWNSRYVTWGYIKIIDDLIGRVNNDKFRSFAAGEVMFDGFDSSPQGIDKRKITYHFRRSPNVTIPAGTFKNKDGQALPAIVKNGHQFIWFEYEQTLIGNSAIAMAPRTAYVEEVGRPGLQEPATGYGTNQDDFFLLGTGS